MKKIRLNKKPVPAMLQSKSYVGVSCVDGTCPKARADDFEEYSIPAGFDCDEWRG